MNDMYIGQKRSNPGCLLILLVVLAAAVALGYWLWKRPPRAERVAATSPASTTEVVPSAQPGSGLDHSPRLMEEARQLQIEDQLLEAREKAYQVLAESSNATVRAGAEALLGEVNLALVTTPRAMPEKQEYTVQPGDSLAVLAKRFGTTVDLIRRGNLISGSVIRAGDQLRIFSGKFALRTDKTRNTLALSLDGRFFKRYSCGTGQFGKTPVGNFIISDKIVNPPWWRPDGKLIPFGDTNNVLGTRWMALSAPEGAGPQGYGIHGTWEPDTIGKQASAGCIRLLNSDVEELFTLVPVGTPVTITD
jgi:lipoprotein-anchoring transpeptidase ErfK/SrfK